MTCWVFILFRAKLLFMYLDNLSVSSLLYRSLSIALETEFQTPPNASVNGECNLSPTGRQCSVIPRNQLGEQLEQQQQQNKLTNSFFLSVCETKNILGALNIRGGKKS